MGTTESENSKNLISQDLLKLQDVCKNVSKIAQVSLGQADKQAQYDSRIFQERLSVGRKHKENRTRSFRKEYHRSTHRFEEILEATVTHIEIS